MRIWTRRSRVTAAGLATALGLGLLAGCSAQGSGRPDNKITVWSLESLPPRMAATRRVVHRFERASGVTVRLVGVTEAQLPQMIMSAAAAGDMPDAIAALPLSQIWQMYGNGLVNTRIAGRVVDRLGPATFDANALGLASDHGTRLGVPSDAWLQLLVYRSDLLRAAGLRAPDTYADLLRAADRLQTGDRVGVSAATDPGDAFTQQSFEDLALANGCRLIDRGGRVTLDSPPCRTAFRTYDQLARAHGAPGTQTVDSTRATYFAGRSAMVIWSSFLLDELAGLRDDALPSCPQCRRDHGYLAAHSGITTALKGPDAAAPAQYGDVVSFTATRTAEPEATERFLTYMMTTGYEDWFGMAPEGKIPVRTGTADDPGRYTRAWRGADMGVDTRRPMDQVYPRRLLDQLVEGVGRMRRWGIAEGQGTLVGALSGELPVAKAVGAMTSGQTSPRQAARDAADEVAEIAKSLR
ncbi:extracellular solute-binding protein [Streptomyces sp. B1866]|uniref:ABC transporter substrate-binding protein n=1 Tax=Streptomyces sp. B1866 TaxID=3075431 RepID=UPI00288D47A0|nr:extracellular solute-binding protein [Streptomyces sp. B1866]MDT3395618.1 extracellular solute-binding protein [Streptomyces sp. B1866]